MRNARAFLLLAVLLHMAGPAAAQDTDREASNIGELQCSAYTLATAGLAVGAHIHGNVGSHQMYDGSLRMLDWISGYLTAFMHARKVPAALIHHDYVYLDRFLRSYCSQNSQSSFQSAVDALIQEQVGNTI